MKIARDQRMTVLTAVLPLLIGTSAVSLEKWQTAGDARLLSRQGERLTLSAKEAATAGMLSPARSASPGSDAVLASADVSDAAAGAITFSVHTASGETIGYWQNPTNISRGRAHAVMQVDKPVGPLRVFVGTHRKPSSATLENVRWEAVRRGMSFNGSMYGAIVHGSNLEAQSFKARGKKLVAVRVLIRRLKENDGPDLRVRIFRKTPDADPYPTEQAVAEATVPRERIPQADRPREEITIALAADTVPGTTYVVEFSPSAPCEKDNGFLLWGGIGTYPGGCRYQNGSAVKDWDLHLEAYDAM